MNKLNLNEQTLRKLQQLTSTVQYKFLGFTLDLEKSIVTDNLYPANRRLSEQAIKMVATLLSHYSSADPTEPTGTLVKFKDIPGGYAYEDAFIKRAVEPIAKIFGENPQELIRTAKLLGGKQLCFGDASAEIAALKSIPLAYILWAKEEFPASANILYDSSASKYLPTEDLAILGEITTLRIIEASKETGSLVL